MLSAIGSWHVLGFGAFSVIRKSDNRWIGRVGPLHPEGWPGDEMGWTLARGAWGNGYATEAARAATEWAFAHLGWSRIIHCIAPDNTASQAVARRLGSSPLGPGKLPAPHAAANASLEYAPMNAIQTPIPARHKGFNRAEIVDQNFTEFVQAWQGEVRAAPHDDAPVLPGSACAARDFRELFESQLISRHLDLMARVLRVQNKVFYTIGSSGHEGNAMLARLTRHTDPAFLHYRSGAFMAERFRKLPNMDPVMDAALSFAASREDPASGGRHKVWGSKPLWVLPQTSTIASHLPKALGTAVAIEQAPRIGHALPVPRDSIVICSFGDASSNHAAAQTTFNAAAWTAYQRLPTPVLFVCEDNGIGISVKTPAGWIANNFRDRKDLDYFFANGLDVAEGYAQVARAVEHCRSTRRPTFLHMKTARLTGHAGTDFEIEWRSIEELVALEGSDPLLRSAAIALESGLHTKQSLLDEYEAIRKRCFDAAAEADRRPKIASLDEVMKPLAPYGIWPCRSTQPCTIFWRSIPTRWCSARTSRRRVACTRLRVAFTRLSRARACSTPCSTRR
jgi:TPP-dependent pyruvate/acetoin dehydrogenase alpha subunit